MGKGALASLQSAVSFLVGLVSRTRALYSALRFVKPAPATGEVLAVVRAAKTDRALPGSAIEVLTPQDALVATLTASDDGSARRALAEGSYRVRVTAPRFRAQTREVQVRRDGRGKVRARPGLGRRRTSGEQDGRCRTAVPSRARPLSHASPYMPAANAENPRPARGSSPLPPIANPHVPWPAIRMYQPLAPPGSNVTPARTKRRGCR